MPSVITPCGGGGGGIQFDTYPQDGDWLHIGTTGSREGVPDGSGIKLTAVHVIDINSARSINLLDTGGEGIYLQSNSGGAGGGFVGIQAADQVYIRGDVISLRSTGDDIELQASGHVWGIFGHAQGVFLEIGSGEAFEVDLSAGGTFALDGLTAINPGGSGRVWNNGGFLAIT